MPDAPSRNLIVAGDVLNDVHLYAAEPDKQRNTPAQHDRQGVKFKSQRGGAHLLHRLIKRVFDLEARKGRPAWATKLGVVPPRLDTENEYSAYAIWRPFPQTEKKPDGPKVWRTEKLLGYGAVAAAQFARFSPTAAANLPAPNLLVLDDAGFRFRDMTGHACWTLAEQGSGYVLLKMSEPVAQGGLWDYLLKKCPDRLVCLVSARDLRREKLGLSRGLSWDATLDDLRLALRNHPAARQLLDARHVVVTFSADGALWLDHTDRTASRACLCFDPMRAEGEWETQFPGGAFGFHCAMTAALTLGLARHTAQRETNTAAPLDLLPAIEAGLLAMRDLKEHGHGPVGDALPKGYPRDRIAEKILAVHDRTAAAGGKVTEGEHLARIDISWPANPATADPRWSIVEASQGGGVGGHAPRKLLDLAWEVAQHGTAALKALPHARFGKLLTADRAEIETLRHIRQRMEAYRRDPAPKRPLSIGVFGPPGAGKSFGVKQLTEEVFGDKSWREFNLSQFNDAKDLNGAFHQVRDLALSGVTPVIFWDEFDSRKLQWLQYLLAPMQDGRFQDDQLNHAIGKCVFIFAGGTSWSYAEFAGRREKVNFQSAKGPDFVSRLDAHMDVLGPDQRTLPHDRSARDPDDVGYPLRRALLLRSYLGCKADEPIDLDHLDPHVLHALLVVNQYCYGARSLEKLTELLRGGEERVLRRSNLPRPQQLKMYVDVPEFTRLMQGEEVAAAIHETWRNLAREQARAEGKTMPQDFDKSYAELDDAGKEDNRAAGRRMPDVLALAGLGMRSAGDGDEPAVPGPQLHSIIEQNIERMAEAEHNGWMNHRASTGWRYDPVRNNAERKHPSMKPYAELPDKEKEKDRNSVRNYPEFAAQANHRIVRLPPKP